MLGLALSFIIMQKMQPTVKKRKAGVMPPKSGAVFPETAAPKIPRAPVNL